MSRRMNDKQAVLLFQTIQSHPEFVADFRSLDPGTKLRFTNFWVELTKRLNERGPPVRTLKAWKKSLDDHVNYASGISRNKKRTTHQGDELSPNIRRYGYLARKDNILQTPVSNGHPAPNFGSWMNASENLYFTSPPPAHQPPKQTNEGLVEKLCEEVVRYHNLRKKMEKEVAAFRQTKKAACENLRDSKKYLEDLHEIRLKQLQEMKRHNSVMEALKKQEKEAQQENRKTKQRRFSQ